MLDKLQDRVNANPGLIRRGRFVNATVLIEVGPDPWLVRFVDGRIASLVKGPFVMATWDFALRAPAEAWAGFWAAHPRPGFHDLMALIKRRALRVEGDLQIFMANLRFFKEVMASLRAGAPA